MTGATGASPLSPRNPKIARLRRLSRRRSSRADEGAAVVEGPTLVLDALAAPATRVQLVVVEGSSGPAVAVVRAAEAAGVLVHELPEGTLDGVLDVVTAQPAAAIIDIPDAVPVPSVPEGVVLVLDAVADPGNVGTLVRTAEAAGVAAVVLGPGCADPWSPKALRASAGSSLRLPPSAAADLAEVLGAYRAAGWRVVGAAGDGTPYDRDGALAAPAMVVLGSEAHGLAPAVRGVLDQVVAVPMAPTVESLNVGVAGAVLLFEAARLRRADSPSGASRPMS